MRNFGEFFNDQIETAACIVFSHTDVTDADKLAAAVELVRARNAGATVVTTDWNLLDGKDILSAIEHACTLEDELDMLGEEHECCCGHHHHDHEEHECCGHHHHDHEEHGCCGHHHHDHEDHEHCGHHHHDHHHHADEVFTSWGVETSKKFTENELRAQLSALSDGDKYGVVLRAKGIVAGEDGWFHFDYIPDGIDIRRGSAAYTGRLCVIGSHIKEEELKKLFGV